MARKSPLSAKQWKEIEQRFYAGERASALAREFGITEAAIRKRFGAKKKDAKKLAIQIVAVETEFNDAEIGTKILARTYADKILAMQDLSSDVGINGLTVAKRLGDVLTKRVAEKTDEELMDEGAIRQLMATGMAINAHSKIGMDMMVANNKQPKTPETPDQAAFLREIAAKLPN